MQSQIFYATGDLQGIDIQRKLYMRVMTNRKFQRIKRIEKCFDVSKSAYDEPFSKHLVYYDIDCIQKDLHLTVGNDYDKDGREILVVQVREVSNLNLRRSIKRGKFTPISHPVIFSYPLGGLPSKEVLTKHSFN